MKKEYFNNLMEFFNIRKQVRLEQVKTERYYEFWDEDFDGFRIRIIADSEKEAIAIFKKYMLDLRTKKVRFKIK